jgi:hypothetical protein
VFDATENGGVLQAVIARVLMGEGGDKERAEKLAGHIFSEADPDIAAITTHSGAIGRVAVNSNGDARLTGDGKEVEWVDEVAGG